MYEEKYRPVVVTTLVGAYFWPTTMGLIHAYLVCPDWGGEMGSITIEKIRVDTPLYRLTALGFLYGLGVELAKFYGSVIRSRAVVLYFPQFVGAAIGGLQGFLIRTDLIGFPAYFIFRAPIICIATGAMAGYLWSHTTIRISMRLREGGRPY